MTGPLARIPALLFLAFLAAALAAAQHEPAGRLDPDRDVHWNAIAMTTVASVYGGDALRTKAVVHARCAQANGTRLEGLASLSVGLSVGQGPTPDETADFAYENSAAMSKVLRLTGQRRPVDVTVVELAFWKRAGDDDSRETQAFDARRGASPRQALVREMDAARVLARIRSSEAFSFHIQWRSDAADLVSPAIPVTAEAREYLGLLAHACMLDLRHAASP